FKGHLRLEIRRITFPRVRHRYRPLVRAIPAYLPVRNPGATSFSAQQTEIAHKGLHKDFFEKGQELTTAQQAQHEILAKLARQGTDSVTPIVSVLEKDGQRETILITSTGVVVNGNRRLAAMRELKSRKDGSVDERFTNINCSVLPPDVTRDEVDDIEADLQARPETKLDYDWIGDAKLIRRQVGKGRSTKEVADRLRRSKTDIENVLQALDEADLYLSEWVGKPGEYDLLQDGRQIFSDLPKAIAKKDANLQNASRAIAWSIYDNREKFSGRIYQFNPAFGRLAPKVLEILSSELDLSLNDEYEELNDSDDFSIDIDDDSDSKDFTPIIAVLRSKESKDKAIETLIDACETAIELDKGQKNEGAALKALVHVNSKIAGIDISTAGTPTLPGILKQIETIRKSLDKIVATVEIRQQGGATKSDEGSEPT
ncbi:MAG: hypothetical protein LAT81_12960, partial [Oceanicaulis sp.]|nr:hypothetical protein [Oceanicaulis sp.]